MNQDLVSVPTVSDGMNENVVPNENHISDNKNVRPENEEIKKIGKDFPFFGGISLLVGIFYTFCLYRNPCGITLPLFVAAAYTAAVVILRRLKIELKMTSFFLIGASILLGISSCSTANIWIHFFNKIGLLLLACIFVLHQFYHDDAWNIGTYMGKIFLYMGKTISVIEYPFRHVNRYVKSLDNKRYKTLILAVWGIGIAVPMLIILTALLSQADAVFDMVATRVLKDFLKPWTLLGIIVKTVMGTLVMYCVICGACKRDISEEQKNRRTKEPIVAIACMGSIAFLYLAFSAIQILYLFLGRGELPGGMTYSDYARQGFFQLLFVVVLNLVMVLGCLKYFVKSKLLSFVLMVINLCTYIMIASAAYRMILYVKEYQLTWLRILVLWFLAMLAVLMAGVVIIICNDRFPLFRYSLVIVSVFYIGFGLSKPDYIIADYNIGTYTQMGEMINLRDLKYLAKLSADAAPVLYRLEEQLPEESEDARRIIKRYFSKQVYSYSIKKGLKMGVRRFNFSYAKAFNL